MMIANSITQQWSWNRFSCLSKQCCPCELLKWVYHFCWCCEPDIGVGGLGVSPPVRWGFRGPARVPPNQKFYPRGLLLSIFFNFVYPLWHSHVPQIENRYFTRCEEEQFRCFTTSWFRLGFLFLSRNLLFLGLVIFSIISNIHQKIGRLVDPLFKNCYTQGKDILGTVKFAKIETLVIRMRSFQKR